MCVIRKKLQARSVQPAPAYSEKLHIVFPQFFKTVRNFSRKQQHSLLQLNTCYIYIFDIVLSVTDAATSSVDRTQYSVSRSMPKNTDLAVSKLTMGLWVVFQFHWFPKAKSNKISGRVLSLNCVPCSVLQSYTSLYLTLYLCFVTLLSFYHISSFIYFLL